MLTYDMHNYAASNTNAPVAPNLLLATVKSSRRSEKYSLRQRHKRKFCASNIADETDTYTSDNNNNNNNNDDHLYLTSSASQSNQLLAFRRERNSTKRACLAPTKSTNAAKSKTKAAPLSKYRRKTANARERTRMREINSAFENLRECVPPTISGEDASCTNEKLTKITTLRLAMKYIQILTDALENPAMEASLLQELELAGDHRFTCDEAELQQKHALLLQEYEQEVPTTKELRKLEENNKLQKNSNKSKNARKSTNKNKTAKSGTKIRTKKLTTKKQRAQKAAKLENSMPIVLSPASTSSAYSSQYSNLCFGSTSSSSSDISNISSIFDNTHYGINQADVNNLLLESDGESLHLSEHCLSPLENNKSSVFGSCTSKDYISLDSSEMLSSLENPLEFSLRILDSDVTDQPSACISSLTGLDTLTPFCDLLPPDFAEHNTLDMFLT